MASSCTMQLAHIIATAGLNIASSCRGSGGASKAVAGNRSLCRQGVTSLKSGGGATSCAASRGPGGDADSCLVPSTCWHSSTLRHWALLHPELWLWGLHLDSQETRGACPTAVTSLEGCNTSLHPGNLVGEASTLMVYSLHSVWGVLSSSRSPQWGLLPLQQPPQWGVGGGQLGTLRDSFLRLVL